MPVPIKPLRDFVVLVETEPEKVSTIIHTVKFDDRIKTGRIVALGTGVLGPNGQVHPIEVKVGEEVAFDSMSAQPIRRHGKDYWVTNELSIRCVLLERAE